MIFCLGRNIPLNLRSYRPHRTKDLQKLQEFKAYDSGLSLNVSKSTGKKKEWKGKKPTKYSSDNRANKRLEC